MARIALNTIVNEQFVNRFAGLASSANDSNALQSALSGSASNVDLSSALRTGASIYASAVSGFNVGLNFLNFARDSLTRLQEIGDELVTLLEDANGSSVSTQGLSRLQREFDRLGEEFQELLESGEVGDRQYLSKEGIEELLVTLGVDPGKSTEIAEIFDTFFLADSEDTINSEELFALASERIRAPRPVRLPSNAFGRTEASTEYSVGNPSAVTNNSNINRAALTDVNSVIELTDPLGSGFNTVQQTSVGPVLSGLVPGLSSDVELLATNEATGFSLINSTEDFLGQNSSNYNQIFLADEIGNIVHQYTNFGSATTILGADIAADDLTIAFTYDDGADVYVNKSDVASAASFGVSAGGTETNLYTGSSGENIQDVKISDNAQYVAYINDSVEVEFFDGTTADTGASATIVDALGLAFTADNQIAVVSQGTAFADLDLYTYGSGTSTNLGTNTVSQNARIAALQKDSGYIAYELADGFGTSLLDVSGTNSEITLTAFAGRVSIAENSDGNVDVGLIITAGALGQFQRFETDATGVINTTVIQTGDNTMTGGISTNNTVYTDTDDTDNLNYNSGNVSLLTLSTDSITTNLSVPLTNSVFLWDTNQDTGYSLISSSQDLLGNGITDSDLFVIDATGRPIKQINTATAGVTLSGATFSEDGNSVFISHVIFSFPDLNYTIEQASLGTLDGDTTNASVEVSPPANDAISKLRVADDGDFIAYDLNGSTVIRQTSTDTEVTLSSEYQDLFTFIDNDQLAIVKTDGQTQDVVQLDLTDLLTSTTTESTLVHGLNNVTNINARQDEGTAGNESILTIYEEGVGRLSAYQIDVSAGTVTERGEFFLNTNQESIVFQGGNRQSISTQRSAEDTFAIGLLGDLSESSGDNDNELYQLNLDATAVAAGQRFSSIVRDFDTIFDDNRDLRRRPETVVLLADVKELVNQIEENISVLDDLESTLGDILSVVRTTGLAMLELSDQISGAEDARSVAEELRSLITRQGGSAIFVHSDKLVDVATAALSLNQDSFGDITS